MDWFIWIAAGIVLAIIEVIFMPGVFVLLFFGVSAAVVGVFLGVGIHAPFWLQMAVFAALAVALIFLFRSKAQKIFGIRPGKMDVDMIAGGVAVASDELAAGGYGKVEFRGSSWNAYNEGSTNLAKGEQCEIVRMEGLKLIVRRSGN